MLRREYTESADSTFKNLGVIEYHDGGFSQFGFSHQIDTRDGHAYVRQLGQTGDRTLDPANQRFAMCLDIYDSPMDFAEITTRAETLTPPWNRGHLAECQKMGGYGGPAWYGGFKKITDGYDMICNGWEEGANKATINLAKTEVPEIDGIESMRRNLIFSDYGETLNIDQAMAGNWEKAWQTCRRIKSGVSRVLSIVIPFGGNCDKSAEQLFWNGAQGMIITDILESKGYRVQLYGGHLSRHDGDGFVWEMELVNIKRPDEPLRLDSVAAIVAHAGVFRTAGFCSVVSKPCKVIGGLGRCQEDSIAGGVATVAKLGKIHPESRVLASAYNMPSAANNIINFFAEMKNGVRND